MIWAAIFYLGGVWWTLDALDIALPEWLGLLYLGSLIIILREYDLAPIIDEFDDD